MLIGELSRCSGLSRDTIRWYEKIGLFKTESTVRDTNNYRVYDHKALEELILIRQSKSFGFSLKQIEELMALIENEDLSCDTVSPIIDAKLDLIEQKIASLQGLQAKLTKLKEECSGDCQTQILVTSSQELQDSKSSLA